MSVTLCLARWPKVVESRASRPLAIGKGRWISTSQQFQLPKRGSRTPLPCPKCQPSTLGWCSETGPGPEELRLRSATGSEITISATALSPCEMTAWHPLRSKLPSEGLSR
mmetsp:Transcript_60969/g.108346  ORF Transcript_60969/g.108346 Transcript_60969/m.108346 type:complete len:110 (-) Transcript_60969:146-475(-)